MIRKAVKNDIQSINELGSTMFNNFLNKFNINEYLENTNYIILVDKENSKLNAFLICYKNIDFYELELIIVDENERNKKIGSRLLNNLIINNLKNGDEILLEVNMNNTNAIKLYNKFNFKVISIRKKYYGDEDAYVMKMVID